MGYPFFRLFEERNLNLSHIDTDMLTASAKSRFGGSAQTYANFLAGEINV